MAIKSLKNLAVDQGAGNEAPAGGDAIFAEKSDGNPKWFSVTALLGVSHNHTESQISDLGDYLENVVEDTTPQLGGALDVNGNSIVSASDGDVVIEPDGTGDIQLNAANVLIEEDIVHSGDINNKVVFGTDTQDFQTGGSSRLDLSDSGVRLGGANARVTTVLDEDDLASDSATALATQQSIKAYVDAQGAGDAAPTQDTSDASTYALADASRLHNNVQVRSHQASVDFEVAEDASAGSAWWVFFDHATCTISVENDSGSVNGGNSVTGVEDGWAVVSVTSNAGTAPVVQVKGDLTEATESFAAHDFADNEVSRAELKDYSETSTTPSSASGTLELDLENGNVFEVTLTEDVTTLTLSNPPASGKAGTIFLIIVQDGTGSHSITWPGSVEWPGGTAPTLTGTAASVDIVSLVTRDGGTTWYGFEGGLNFG